jgi:hypothetical protein
MARYISEEEFIAWVKDHWCADCKNDNGLRCRSCWIDDAIDVVEEAPAADVVPREEVDRLHHILNSYALQYGTAKDQQAVIDRIKAETAREIFEEIDTLGTYNPTLYSELEKKYTAEDDHELDNATWSEIIANAQIGALSGGLIGMRTTLDDKELKNKFTENSTDGKRTDR